MKTRDNALTCRGASVPFLGLHQRRKKTCNDMTCQLRSPLLAVHALLRSQTGFMTPMPNLAISTGKATGRCTTEYRKRNETPLRGFRETREESG